MKCSKCQTEVLPGDECVGFVEGVETRLCVHCYELWLKGPLFTLQRQASDKRYWCDLGEFPTAAEAWASVTTAGRYRVIRVQTPERTAIEQTTIRWEDATRREDE